VHNAFGESNRNRLGASVSAPAIAIADAVSATRMSAAPHLLLTAP
jgi:hypothetical protein